MLTYGPGINIFMGQIGSFINMYIRRTVLNGSIPINKSSLSGGDIFRIFFIIVMLNKKILIFLEFAGSA